MVYGCAHPHFLHFWRNGCETERDPVGLKEPRIINYTKATRDEIIALALELRSLLLAYICRNIEKRLY